MKLLRMRSTLPSAQRQPRRVRTDPGEGAEPGSLCRGRAQHAEGRVERETRAAGVAALQRAAGVPGTGARVENDARAQRRQVEALQQELPHLALQYRGGIVGRSSAIEGTPHPAGCASGGFAALELLTVRNW